MRRLADVGASVVDDVGACGCLDAVGYMDTRVRTWSVDIGIDPRA